MGQWGDLLEGGPAFSWTVGEPGLISFGITLAWCLLVFMVGLSDYLNSIHYCDSLRLFMNKIVDCPTI